VTRIVLGTRGSDLARAQTSLVESALRAAHPELDVMVEVITTRGDEKIGAGPQLAGSEEHLSGAGRKGHFTAEIERALLHGQIDVAVHSAKDLPSDGTSGLKVCATLVRGPVEDVLLTKDARDLRSLPAGATVATGSVRRQYQLRHFRADLELVDLRGNVPTRLRKLAENPWDAIILARAGLERLGFDCASGEIEVEDQIFRSVVLSAGEFLPAGGQGVVALQVRSADEHVVHAVKPLNHLETLLCLRAEREFLRLLQGDCGTPVGVLATYRADSMTMKAQLFEKMRPEPRAASLHRKLGGKYEPESIAAELLDLINGE